MRSVNNMQKRDLHFFFWGGGGAYPAIGDANFKGALWTLNSN